MGHGVYLADAWREPGFNVVRAKVLAVSVLRGACQRRSKVYKLPGAKVEAYSPLEGRVV